MKGLTSPDEVLEFNRLEDEGITSRSSLRSRSSNRSRNRSQSRSKSTTGQRKVSTALDRSGVEFLGPRDNEEMGADELAAAEAAAATDGKLLAVVFVCMVFVGLMNKIFNKLMTIPMYNYPNFLNLMTSFVYIPVCFAYIIPAARRGWIPQEQLDLPKRPFAVMGALDACAGIMQIFGVTYLPGPLIILLLQAAIPVSMIISKYMINAQYSAYQYIGALIVAGGIAVVLVPSINGGGSIVWVLVIMLSTVPMALSSVYKEIALGETELDPIYLNGWIAIFQFLFSILLCIPSSLASDPPVGIPGLPQNLWDGVLCYVGISSITCDDDNNCTPDQCMPDAPTFVNIYLFFNLLYNQLIILIIKYGSSNILYLALTMMVPLGNVAFTLPFMPQHSVLKATDIIGLVVICSGLGCYRFAQDFIELACPGPQGPKKSTDSRERLRSREYTFSPLGGDEEEAGQKDDIKAKLVTRLLASLDDDDDDRVDITLNKVQE